MKSQQIFDYLKLKGSVGVLGNQSTLRIDRTTPINYVEYPHLNTGFGSVSVQTLITRHKISWIPNPDLKWETVASQEIGVELNAFTNRLHFEGTYFNKVTQ